MRAFGDDERRAHLSTLATSPQRAQAAVRLATARWRALGFWALFVALLAACALCVVAPLDRDEGAFLVIAQLALHGRLPYRDVWDQKPPGIYYLLAALLALTRGLGPHAQIIALRLAAVAANALTALGLLRLGARLHRPRAGRLAALLWLAACAAPLFGANQLFTEPFATAATVWAAVWLLRQQGARAAFVAGLLLALGALFKQTAIIALPAFALLLYAQPAPDAVRSAWQRGRTVALGALLAGAALPWLALLGVYALLGAAGDLLYQVVIVNITGYPAGAGANVPEFLALTLGLLYGGPLLLLALTLARHLRQMRQARRLPRSGGLRASWRREPALTLAALGWLLIGQTLPMFAHPYPHYLIQPLPWLALLLALGVAPATAAPEGRASAQSAAAPPSLGARIAQVVGLALIAPPLLFGVALATASAPASLRALDTQLATGALIAADTPPGASLLVAPAEPEYYYLSGRLPTTRYVYLLPVNQATFPLALVTRDIRARRFAVVVWIPNSVAGSPPEQYAAVYAALTQSYHQAPGSSSSDIIFQR